MKKIFFVIGIAVYPALAHASRILFMKEGKIRYEANNPDEVTGAVIKDIFDVNATVIRPGNGLPPVVIYQ